MKYANRSEKQSIERAMSDPVLRTAAIVGGILLDLPAADRTRVLSFVVHTLNADESRPRIEVTPLRLHDASAPATGTSGD